MLVQEVQEVVDRLESTLVRDVSSLRRRIANCRRGVQTLRLVTLYREEIRWLAQVQLSLQQQELLSLRQWGWQRDWM